MKRKHLFVAMAALIAAGGLWLSLSLWRTHPVDKSSMGVGSKMVRGSNTDPNSAASLPRASQSGPDAGSNSTNPGPKLRPPDQTRVFRDFTPEDRVKFARKGHGPGG